ncbi:hypothetical protein CC1G_11918 [Coprinopsis cinerea okayama7|uniref:BRCT domain-containing protein n=1 Tax=Coprinopsis cinerea (strain Okayama-7 / 130 / ATCC MYA-4618 / FGSC 9003) TaxID=240176 RepID=A8NDE2_COPC7|nr:hypothetical protein CC1G_11918 [Coprinopsis cinerea okayama7\|eukprot:XP_001832754.2 hypothetical protein CC1G_11918 [Coprinopsis cinerea okayama7\
MLFSETIYHLSSSLSQHTYELTKHLLDKNGGTQADSLDDADVVITDSARFEGWQNFAVLAYGGMGVHDGDENSDDQGKGKVKGGFEGENATPKKWAVTPKWVERSVVLGKLQSPQFFSPDPAMLFSGVVACATEDLEVLSAGILALGGQWRTGLTKDVTHLFTIRSVPDPEHPTPAAIQASKYLTALHFQPQTGVKVVLPHWFDDCVRLGIKNLDTKPYEFPDPPLLRNDHLQLPNHGADGAVDEETRKRQQKIRKATQTEKDPLKKSVYTTSVKYTPGRNAGFEGVIEEDGDVTLVEGDDPSIPRTLPFKGHRILISRSLKLGKGRRREAIEAGIRRAGGVVVRWEGDDEDEGVTEPVSPPGRDASDGPGMARRRARSSVGAGGSSSPAKPGDSSVQGTSPSKHEPSSSMHGHANGAANGAVKKRPEDETPEERDERLKKERRERDLDRKEAEAVQECDVFITRWREGRGYLAAYTSHKTIGTLAWLYHVQSTGVLTRPQDQLLHYPIPKERISGFSGHEITVTNYTGEAREYLKKLIITMGATFTPSMSGKNTVLIAATKDSTKAQKALSWSIPVVNHTWLEDCFVQWRNLTLASEKYLRFPDGVDFSAVLGERGVGFGGTFIFPRTAPSSTEKPATKLPRMEEEIEELMERYEDEDGEDANVDLGVGMSVDGHASGEVTGDLTGAVTGDLAGEVTGDITGDTTGAMNGDDTRMDVDVGIDEAPQGTAASANEQEMEEVEALFEDGVDEETDSREKSGSGSRGKSGSGSREKASSKGPGGGRKKRAESDDEAAEDEEEEEDEEEVVSSKKKSTSKSKPTSSTPKATAKGKKKPTRPTSDSDSDVEIVQVVKSPVKRRGDHEEEEEEEGEEDQEDTPKRPTSKSSKPTASKPTTSAKSKPSESTPKTPRPSLLDRPRGDASTKIRKSLGGGGGGSGRVKRVDTDSETEDEDEDKGEEGDRMDVDGEDDGNIMISQWTTGQAAGTGGAKGKAKAKEREEAVQGKAKAKEVTVQGKGQGKTGGKRKPQDTPSETEDEDADEDEGDSSDEDLPDISTVINRAFAANTGKQASSSKPGARASTSKKTSKSAGKGKGRNVEEERTDEESTDDDEEGGDRPPKKRQAAEARTPKRVVSVLLPTLELSVERKRKGKEKEKKKRFEKEEEEEESEEEEEVAVRKKGKAAAGEGRKAVASAKEAANAKGRAKEKEKEPVRKAKARPVEEDEEDAEEEEEEEPVRGKKGREKAKPQSKAKSKRRAEDEMDVEEEEETPAPPAKKRGAAAVTKSTAKPARATKKPVRLPSDDEEHDQDRMDVDQDHDEEPPRSSAPSPSRSAPPSSHPSSTSTPAPEESLPRKRSAATKATAKLRDELMPDLVNFEQQLRKSNKAKGKGKGRVSDFFVVEGDTPAPEVRESSSRKKAGEGKGKEKEEGRTVDDAKDGKKRRRSEEGAGAKGKARQEEEEEEEEEEVSRGKKKRRISDQRGEVVSRGKAGKEKEKDEAPAKLEKPVYILATQVKFSDNVIKPMVALGAKFTDRPADCTHLVAKGLVRTEKFLCALSRAPFIVSEDWVNDSAKAKKLLPEDKYMLKDPIGEERYGVTVQTALERAKQNKGRLLGGKTFYITPKVQAGLQLMKSLIVASGGTVSTSQPTVRILKGAPERYVISAPEDAHIWRVIAEAGIPVYSQELVLMGVLRQEVDWDEESHRVDLMK